MNVLAQNNRLVPRAVLCILLRVLYGVIHSADNICGLGSPITLVVDKPTLVKALDELVHGPVVAAIARLVAQRPEDDAWAVEVPHDHLASTINVGFLPIRIVGCELVTIHTHNKQAMTLEVALVQDPQAKLICQFVQPGVIDVMRSSDGVDVVPLHEQEVLLQKVKGNCPSMVRMMFMSVDTAELDRLSVDTKDSINEFNFAEANPFSKGTTRHRKSELVQIGGFGRPFVGILDMDIKVYRSLAGLCLSRNLDIVRIQETQGDISVGVKFDPYMECCIFVLVV